MKATTAPGEGNLVHLTVEIEEPEVDRALDGAFKTLAKQVTVPGFRPGRVPRQILEVRMGGAAALRAEALKEVLPEFCLQALVETAIDPIARPKIDITAGEDHGPVTFEAVIQVRPIVAIPGYAGLQVTVPRPLATDEEVDFQIDRLRDNEGELVDVERPVADGDQVTIDLQGVGPGGAASATMDDYLYEVGTGEFGPELDQTLRGAAIGDTLEFSTKPPGAAAVPGAVAGTEVEVEAGTEVEAEAAPLAFTVVVKDVKEKILPEPTDEWAAESSEYGTIDELRSDIADRVTRVKRVQAEQAMREGSVEALHHLVEDSEVPEVLVESELQHRANELQRRLHDQGMDVQQLLANTGRTEEMLVAGLRVEALQAVKIDLALRALAEAEDLEVTDAELDEQVALSAKGSGVTADELRARIDTNGGMAAVRSDLRKSKALDWLLEHVELVDEEGSPVSREDVVAEVGAGQTTDQQPRSDAEGVADDDGGADVPSGGAAPGERAEATEETD